MGRAGRVLVQTCNAMHEARLPLGRQTHQQVCIARAAKWLVLRQFFRLGRHTSSSVGLRPSFFSNFLLAFLAVMGLNPSSATGSAAAAACFRFPFYSVSVCRGEMQAEHGFRLSGVVGGQR